jgi:predicted anti-sigma-YlaC factor YlaD
MKCEEIKEIMPDVAAGLSPTTPEVREHLTACSACAGKLDELRKTMALLDEWKAPEPSPYFDVRLQARLREEMAKPQAGWLTWFRRPVLAAALTVLMAVGIGLFFRNDTGIYQPEKFMAANDGIVQSGEGSAVSDLQSLEKNQDVYSDLDLLDDLQVQPDVTANP